MSDDTNKRGAFATGALAIGGLTVANAVGERNSSEREIAQQQPGQVLIFAYDYQPTLSFQMINQLQQGTVDAILGGDPGLVSDPADYNGYVVVYRPGGETQGEYTLVFVREDVLQRGTQYTFTESVSFFDTQANLLQAGISSGAAAETTPEEEETTPKETTPEEEETTPKETTPANETTTTTETTEEVVVNATETTPEGG